MNLQQALKNKIKSKLAISISSNPGTFGIRVHNAMLKVHNIDCEYQACTTDNLFETIHLLKKHNVVGCSVSMPYKIAVMPMLDYLDTTAQKAGAVNTIVNESGSLIGYNTDLVGAKWACSQAFGKIALLGNGGMSRAFQAVLTRPYTLIQRRNWHELRKKYDTIINATPIGMLNDDSPVNNYNHSLAIDSVVRMTPFVKFSKRSVNGIDICLQQIAAQYKLYFKKEVIFDVMKTAIKDLYD